MSNPKKNPQKPQQAWKGIPSIDNPGWQFLFLGNPKTGQLVKIEIPKRYAFDKRGLAIPDNVKNAKVKGVKYTMHKKEKHWDALIAKKQLDRLFSAGFIIIPPSQIQIVTSADAKKFKPQHGEFEKARKKKRGKRGDENNPNPNDENAEYIFGEGDENEDGDEESDSDEFDFKERPSSKDLAPGKSSKSNQGKDSGKPSPQKGQPSSDGDKEEEGEKGEDGKGKSSKDGEKDKDDKGKNNSSGDNKSDQDSEKDDRNEEVDDDGNSDYDQYSKNTEENDTPAPESTDSSVNEDEDGYDEEFDAKENEKAREAERIAKEQERMAFEKAKSTSSASSSSESNNEGIKPEDSERKIQQKIAKAPRKHRGNRRRLGNRTVAVDKNAKGKSGNGSRVRGIYSYSEVVFNAKVYHAAKKSAAVLSAFIGKSLALLEYGIKSDIPQLLIRLESGDNPIPALEVPQNRPKMKIMISPDCSPSTHDWNGLSCAWAIMLAKSPDLDVLFCVNSNGEPVNMSSDRYLTLMRSSDMIIYLGDADGMFHNKAWARDYGQHVIALSSAQTSIGNIPKYKLDNKMVHLIVQKYKRGVLRYVTGVSSKDPRTWVKALNLCMLSLEAGQ